MTLADHELHGHAGRRRARSRSRRAADRRAADDAPPLADRHARDLQVGQKVFAIGNPFGLDQTLTTGIISAAQPRDRRSTGRAIKDIIQTDAAINPGNSGGPLLDSAGRLIGVNTAIFSPSGASAGIGFAIPVDTVNRVVPQLIPDGRLRSPASASSPPTRSAAAYWRRPVARASWSLQVVAGSPAARAGLHAAQMTSAGRVVLGDVIVAIDGKKIEDFGDLASRLDEHVLGDRVTITVERDGKRRDVFVTLGGAEDEGEL